MDTLRIFLFGKPHIERNGRAVTVKRRKVMALLAYLAITGQPQSRDVLVTLFWPEADPKKARANLRRDLSRLKQLLTDKVINIERKQVALIPQAYWLDVADFQIKAAQAQKHKHAPADLCGACLQAMETAVAAYSGEFMAGFALSDSSEFDDWQFFQREGYRQLLAYLLQQLMGWYEAQGNYEQAIAYGRGWLHMDSLHEAAHRELMKLYAFNEQQSAALRQYEECARLLAEELDIKPDSETTELFEAIKERRFPAEVKAARTGLLFTPPEERFEQGTLLAVGGHGEVYYGRDRLTGEKIVIKRLKPELGQVNPEIVTRFIHEGELLSQLNHPNIVRMLTTMERDNQHLLVMEYVSGGTLRDLLNAPEPLPISQILDIALELADALARAHHLNIVHRDLKPGNVLIAADGTPRLTDFGVAMLQNQDSRLTRPGSFIGSPAYMSPEMLQNKQPDIRSDIWSFGVLLYEMLAGKNPFEAEQMTAVLMNILNEEVRPIQAERADVPEALADLLARMLVKERDGRIASMRQVGAELEAIRAGRAVEYTPAYGFTPKPFTPAAISRPNFPTPAIKPPSNIPSDPTPLLGRLEELVVIKNQLLDARCRLLTIVAMGGMGKTRLAIATAKHFLDEPENPFSDGVVFVSFVGIDEADAIPTTLVKALDLRLSGQDDPLGVVVNYLQNRQILLVLDNCEQLMDGVLVFNELLQASPGSKLLVTSREPLNIEAEWRFDLEGLDFPIIDDQLPTTEYPAVQLFLQTAKQVQPGFELTAVTIPAVLQLCKLVAGMPLALKLAATWLRVMSCERIVEEVSRNLDILTSRMRDLPPRQRSMRAIFEQTWDLLPPEEQAVFQSLSVFRGGFSEEATETTLDVSHFFLVGLVERGLVVHASDGRYEIHELTRQFAAEKLHESDQETAVITKHGTYYLTFVAQQEIGLHSQMPSLATAALRQDFENIKQAWNWAVSVQQTALLAESIEPLATFFELAGLLPAGEQMFGFATDELEKYIAEDEVIKSTCCLLYIKTALVRSHRGYLNDTSDLLQKAESLLAQIEDAKLVAQFSFVRGHIKHQMADEEGSQQDLQTAVDMFEQMEDLHWLTAALNYLGDTLARNEKADEALACHKRALLIAAELGDAREEALALSFIGAASYFNEAFEDSLTYFEQANKLFEQVDDLLALARTTSNLGHVHGRLGDYEKSYTFAKQATALFIKVGADGSFTSDILGDAAMAFGDYELAREHYEAGLASSLSRGQPYVKASNFFCLAKLDTAIGQFERAEAQFQQAIAIVESVQLNRYVAIFKGHRGILYRHMNRLDEAISSLDESLFMLQEMGNLYYTGGFLIEKAEIQFHLQNYIGALALVTAGLTMVKDVGRKPAIFDGRLLLTRIHCALGDQDKAVSQLEQLLLETESAPELAAIHYAFWQVRGRIDDALQALSLYQELVDNTPDIRYVNRIAALQTAVAAQPV